MKLQLDQKTLNALDASIQHWKNYTDGNGEVEGFPGTQNCALCVLFCEQDCKGCPIHMTTKRIRCCNSPYRKTVEALYNKNEGKKDFKSPEFLLAAKEELDFLISIRKNSELKQS